MYNQDLEESNNIEKKKFKLIHLKKLIIKS